MTEIRFRDDVDVQLVKSNATDIDVARAAWVSTLGEDAREKDGDRVPGLLNFLIRDRHGSPFEHGSLTFFIRCPIFVIREFHRHRAGWSYNEESGRYTVLKPEFYVPNRDRNLVQSGKPGQYVFGPGDHVQYEIASGDIKVAVREAWRSYENMLGAGIAKEVARMCLPLNIYSSFYATCNPRSLMHFLGLRTENENATYKSHPQKEIQMVADKMEALFAEQMPLTYDSWNKNGRVSP